MRYRLVALDIDGTILDDAGEMRPAVHAAIDAVRARGLQVILCTGRRYRTAEPFVRALQLDGPIVTQNGVLVRDAATSEVLESRLLPVEVYERAYRMLCEVGAPLVYLHDHPEGADFLFEAPDRSHLFQREYLDDHGASGCELASLERAPEVGLVMMSAMADRESLSAIRPRVEDELGPDIRTHLIENRNYRGFILEIVSARAGKWPALAAVARRMGVDACEILAIGDDQNDLEMITRAGLGIAMGNAPPEVQTHADEVTASHVEDGVVRALERHVLV